MFTKALRGMGWARPRGFLGNLGLPGVGWWVPGGAKHGQELDSREESLVVSVSLKSLFLSSTWPTSRSQHRVKSEHFRGR